MHSARFASGLAPSLERIGTRSQDSINEGSFAEKVTCFPTNMQRLSSNWRCRLVVKVQPVCPIRSACPSAASAAVSLALKSIDSGLVVRVSGPSAMPTVLCYILLKRSRSERVKTRLEFGSDSNPGSHLLSRPHTLLYMLQYGASAKKKRLLSLLHTTV